MKRLVLLALCALFALPASADQVVIGTRTWSFDPNPDGRTCVARGVFPANGSIAVPATLGGLTVTRIDPDLFDNPTVTALSIPAGVKEIGYNAGDTFQNEFGGLTIKKITVAAGNRVFSAAGGVLYDKRKTKIYAVLPSKKGSYKVPASVRTIGEDAFCGSRLKSVRLPARLGTIEDLAFDASASLKKVTIPASVTRIGEYAFAPHIQVLVAKKNKKFSASGGVLFDKRKTKLLHCPSTKTGSYTVPASVTTIAQDAFEGCAGLTSIKMGAKVKTIGDGAFCGCSRLSKVTLGKNVRSIGYDAFGGCTKLASIQIPSGTTHIGSDAFYGCSSLKRLSIPASVKAIGYLGTNGYVSHGNPFGRSGVSSVTVAGGNKAYKVVGGCLLTKDGKTLVAVPPARSGALTIPSTVTGVGSDPFDGCGKLTSITIPAGMDYLWSSPFDDCKTWNAKKKRYVSALATFKVAAGNKSYTAVGGVLFSKDRKTLVAYPCGKQGAYTVPSSVRTIGTNAFSESAVTSITIPDSVTEIQSSAFSYCDKLKSVRLPSKLTQIPSSLFSGDGALTSVSIPSSVTAIGYSAFSGSGLMSVSIPSKVASIGSWTFSGCSKLSSATVPASVKSIGEGAFACWDRKSGIKNLSLPNKGVCDIARQELPASCNVTYRDKTPVYWIRFVSNGGYPETGSSDTESVYDANGYWNGYAVRSFAFRDKATALPANPFKNGGNAFAGWATTPNGGVKYKDMASVKNLAAAGRSATLYAVWRPVRTTYKFNANGGSGSMDALVVDYEERNARLPYCSFRRDGWTFDHWNTKADDSGSWYDDEDYVYCEDDEKDVTITLYAIWNRTPDLTVSFRANGGEGEMNDMVIAWNDWGYAPYCGFYRYDGWYFDHWSTDPDDWGSSYRADDEIWNDDDTTTNLVLYAIWAEDYGYAPPAPASSGSVCEDGGSASSADDAPWTESEFVGEPCLESGTVGDGGKSVRTMTVDGPGTLAFRWRTSSEEGHDIVFLSVDDKDVAARSGLDDDWTTVSLRVEGDGPHVLSWTYAKDASGSAGDDRARLADVVWIAD